MKKKRKYIYLEKCLIIRILQIYIFSFYDFLFFISLSDAKSSVKAVKDFMVGEDTLNVMAITVSSKENINEAKDELINTCTNICTEINTTTHLAVWRRYLRTVWLHI